MSAIKMDELKKLEEQAGFDDGGLSYQQRCSRITAWQKGEPWEPKKHEPKPGKLVYSSKPANTEPQRKLFTKDHPMYGKKILITPKMRPNKNEDRYYEENLGSNIKVREANAGEKLYSAADGDARIFADYDFIAEDPDHEVVAKTWMPKIGTELSIRPGVDLCVVCEGNDGQKGYVMNFPFQQSPAYYFENEQGEIEEFHWPCFGLKYLLRSCYPDLEPKFENAPLISYIDGITECASIPMTHNLIREHIRKLRIDEQAGIR